MNKANQIITIIAAIILIVCPHFVFAQTAGLMPMAVQQFFDNNGNPLSAGTVTTYIAGTSTLKTTWRDAAETIANTNPIVLDAGGKAIIFGEGNYRQLVKDRNGNIIWDAITSAFGTGTASQLGDGTRVGTILPWSGLVAPVRYAFAYGQELSRITYLNLYSVITLSANVSCTSSSNILSGFSDTTQIPIGAAIEVSCVAAGTTVTAKSSSTVTVSNNASTTIAATAVIFPWGNGNGTTTFNVPDLRGRVLPGRDNMGGTAAARLTTAIYGAANPDSLGGAGGSQSRTLLTANLPAYTPTGTVTDSGHVHPLGNNMVIGASGIAAGQATVVATGGSLSTASGTANSTFAGVAQGGASTPFAIVQPSITLNYIVKILPDVSISTLNVVTSLGGMVGDVTCSGLVVCSGNNISVAGAGSGDLVGPASSTDNAITRFDGTTGKLVQNSLVTISDAGTISLTSNNSGIEIGGIGVNTPFIDGHSSGNANDYDARLIWSGGGVGDGAGTVSLIGTLSLNPPPSTLQRAFNATQSAAGAPGSSVTLNSIFISGDTVDAGSGFVDGIAIVHSMGGLSAKGGRQVLDVVASLDGARNAANANPFVVAGVFRSQAQATEATAAIFALNLYARAQNNSTVDTVNGMEINPAITAGSATNDKYGMSIIATADDAVAGSRQDAAMFIVNQTGAVGWKNLYQIGSAIAGQFPLQATGTVMNAIQAGTVAHGIDFTNLTCSSDCFKSTGFLVSGSGALTATLPTSAGGGGLFVCIDTAGVMYKKATCP